MHQTIKLHMLCHITRKALPIVQNCKEWQERGFLSRACTTTTEQSKTAKQCNQTNTDLQGEKDSFHTLTALLGLGTEQTKLHSNQSYSMKRKKSRSRRLALVSFVHKTQCAIKIPNTHSLTHTFYHF